MAPFIILMILLAAGALGYFAWNSQKLQQTKAERRVIELVQNRRQAKENLLASGLDPVMLLARNEKHFTERVRRELWRAGMKMPPNQFIMIVGGGGALLGLVGLVVFRNPLALIVGALMGAGSPLMALQMMKKQRRSQIEAQLPEALNLSSSTLRSGYSLLQAMQMICEEMAPPISEEFRMMLDELKIGMTLENALERMGSRVDSRDIDLLITAVSIQTRLGGNLAEILDTIGESVRQRFQFRSEVSALTAEGRLSGYILFAMPLMLLAYLIAFNPTYVRPLLVEPIGQEMLAGALIMQLVGGLVIRKMIMIDV